MQLSLEREDDAALLVVNEYKLAALNCVYDCHRGALSKYATEAFPAYAVE